MIFSLYQIYGLPAIMDLILQKAGKQIIMVAYIGILLMYGWGISYKVWTHKFIWMTRKARFKELAYSLYGLQVMALTLILSCVPAFSDSAGKTIHLKEILIPHQMIEQSINILNCFSCSVILFKMLFLISRRDSIYPEKLVV